MKYVVCLCQNGWQYRERVGGMSSVQSVVSRLKEPQAGILCFTSPEVEGFSAVLKARYSDFQVHEINIDGEVAILNNTDVPEPSKKDDIKNESHSPELGDEIISLDDWNKIKSIADSKQSSDKVEIDATEMSKECRTLIHNKVKSSFGKKIVGSTITVNNKKFLIFSKPLKGSRTDVREKWMWDEEYVHFILYKENCDTMEAASLIADRLNMRHVKPSYFGYCGTKDKRAKTSQWFSVRKIHPKKIFNACKNLRNMEVGNYKFKNYNLKLGSLKGNRFEIALRNIVASKDLVENALNNLKNSGFINYYGLQRFGSRTNVPTYLIGKCLLQEDFEKAVELILEPHGKHYDVLKKYQETKDAECALALLKKSSHNSLELKLLQSLKTETSTSNKKYIDVLNKLPRNLRLLYIHSYQSWIWNNCVSERLRKLSYNCCVGDLVLLEPLKSDQEIDIPDDFTETESAVYDKVEIKNEKNTLKTMTQNKDISLNDDIKFNVKVLTEEDIKSSKFSIFDVIMPLPGFNIEYPPNMKDYYEKILKNDNLDLNLKQKLKAYSLGGTYRYIITKPENLSWELVNYTDPHCDLIASDLDKLKNRQVNKNFTDGRFKALLLNFDLPSSTYATMALRELLKMDTSGEIQAQNNDYYKENNMSDKKSPSNSDDGTNNSILKRKTEDNYTRSNKKQKDKV